jgi:hypothetical protein
MLTQPEQRRKREGKDKKKWRRPFAGALGEGEGKTPIFPICILASIHLFGGQLGWIDLYTKKN